MVFSSETVRIFVVLCPDDTYCMFVICVSSAKVNVNHEDRFFLKSPYQEKATHMHVYSYILTVFLYVQNLYDENYS